MTTTLDSSLTATNTADPGSRADVLGGVAAERADQGAATTPTNSSTVTTDAARLPGLAVLLISTVLTGMFAGFFFTYSASVVLGFDRVDDLTYVRSFQAINDTIRNPAFAVVFFGSIPAAAIAVALHRRDRVVRRLATTGLVLIVAVVAITFAGSVPLNNELATHTDLDAASAAIARADFESTWNLLNLARTLLSTLAAVALAGASIVARGSRD
jgi:uncharacterized membrane protein